MLNVDYKIASKVIATRFEKVLDLLISPDQTGFLKGRYNGQNIRLVNDVVEQTKIQKIRGILVQLDFCKAFETIAWSWRRAAPSSPRPSPLLHMKPIRPPAIQTILRKHRKL